MDLTILPVFLAAAIALNLTPGPDFAFTLASAARGGVRAGLMAGAGICAGVLVWIGLTAAGLAALIAAFPAGLDVIRWLGGAYLIYLAITTLKGLRNPKPLDAGVSSGAAFQSGLITNCLNPKIGVFFLAVLPGFATGPAPVWQQILILGVMFTTSSAIILSLIALAAGTARTFLDRSIMARRVLTGLSGLAYGGLGVRLLLTRPA